MSTIPFPSQTAPTETFKALEELTLQDLIDGKARLAHMERIVELLSSKQELPPNLTEAFCTLGIHFLNMECIATISTMDPKLSFKRFVDSSWIFANVVPDTFGLVIAGIQHEMHCIPKMKKEHEAENQREDFLAKSPLNDGGKPA